MNQQLTKEDLANMPTNYTPSQVYDKYVALQKQLATNITNKGVTASQTELYDNLIDKVAQIENLKGEERLLENFTNVLSKPKSVVQLEYPEPKNLFDKDNANIIVGYPSAENVIEPVSTTKSIYIPCAPNTTYTVSKVVTARFAVAFTDVLPASGVAVTGKVQNKTATSITATSGANSKYIVVWMYHSTYDTTTTVDEILATLQIELGSTATPYEPYPAPKTLNAKLSSVNLFDETTLLSVDHTEDEEAYIFRSNVLYRTRNLTPDIKFKEKTSYTLRYTAKQAPNTGSTALPYPRLQIYYTDGTSDLTQTTTEYKTIIVQSNANKTVAYISSGYSTNGLFYIKKNSIQLIEGAQSKLGDYTPYISDFSTVNVTRCGKNLTTPQQVYKGASAYSEEIFENKNCVRFSSGGTIKNSPIAFKPNTQYTVSFDVKTILRSGQTTSGADNVFCFFYDDGTRSVIYNIYTKTDWAHKELTSTVGKTVVAVGLYSVEYRSYSYVDADSFQLEEGSTTTTYEPYQGQTYTSTTTGEVTGITNLYPATTLLTDNAGVVFEQVTGGIYKEILPSTDKNGITKVYQPSVDSTIDSNITSDNIKQGVNILGVTGDYICNYTYDETMKELVLIL